MFTDAFQKEDLNHLWGLYVATKVTEYTEPQRKGTPKGEPIGISKKKLHATLLALTDMRGKKVAAIVGVSHGLYRKWKTEDNFKLQMCSNMLEWVKVKKHYEV